jgi:hypothetical protein
VQLVLRQVRIASFRATSGGLTGDLLRLISLLTLG